MPSSPQSLHGGRRTDGIDQCRVGIVTGSLGIVSEALRPLVGMGYIVYGLLLSAWFVLVGLKLFALRK